MEKRKNLDAAIHAVDEVCKKLLKKMDYRIELQICVQVVSEMYGMLEGENADTQKFLRLLEEMLYGMTQKDEVFLLDVLRFGLKPELERMNSELEINEPEGIHE